MTSDLIGKPFQDLGRGPDHYDCWGLVIEVGKRMGIDFPDYEYIHAREQERIQGHIDSGLIADFIEVKKPMPGDVAIFKTGGFGELHFGIFVDSHHVLHTGPKVGVRKNSIHSLFFRQTIQGFYRCMK